MITLSKMPMLRSSILTRSEAGSSTCNSWRRMCIYHRQSLSNNFSILAIIGRGKWTSRHPITQECGCVILCSGSKTETRLQLMPSSTVVTQFVMLCRRSPQCIKRSDGWRRAAELYGVGKHNSHCSFDSGRQKYTISVCIFRCTLRYMRCGRWWWNL